jgi:predicted RecA/RadA family phage recombinase
MNNYVGEGEKINVVAGGTLTSGTPAHTVDGQILVPEASAVSGDVVSAIVSGAIRVPKVTGSISGTPHSAAEAITQGAKLYWDSTNNKATAKAIGAYLGRAVLAAASSDAYVIANVGKGTENPGPIVVTGYFDATDGKAAGTYSLAGMEVPSGYTPLNGTYKVLTTFTSATDAATIALGVHTDDDDCLKAAVAISNGANPWDAGQFNFVAAAAVQTTSTRALVAKVASESLTAGKLAVSVVCIRSGF